MGTITTTDGTEIFYEEWALASRSCSATAGRSPPTPGTGTMAEDSSGRGAAAAG